MEQKLRYKVDSRARVSTDVLHTLPPAEREFFVLHWEDTFRVGRVLDESDNLIALAIAGWEQWDTELQVPEMLRVWVHPDYRHQGVGRQLAVEVIHSVRRMRLIPRDGHVELVPADEEQVAFAEAIAREIPSEARINRRLIDALPGQHDHD